MMMQENYLNFNISESNEDESTFDVYAAGTQYNLIILEGFT